ncbi:MAG: RHS repeat-associated core domain-containing protein, partial [Angustibacter sp.]
PLGHKTQRFYTIDGQLDTIVNARNKRIKYKYDNLGRLTQRSFSDAKDRTVSLINSSTHFSSSPSGMTDSFGTEYWDRDEFGRLVEVNRQSTTPGIKSGIWTYSYNSDGTLREAKRPDGTSQTWTYDAASQPLTQTLSGPAGPLTAQYAWDPDGQLVSSTVGGREEWQSWDRAGRLSGTGVRTSSGVDLVSQSISRDQVGNPTGVAVTRNGATEAKSYSFDANNRLEGVCYQALPTSGCSQANSAQWWTYDLSGNRIAEQTSSPTPTRTSSTYDLADRLTGTSVNGGPIAPLTWDADGNLTASAGATWTYDAANRAQTRVSSTGVSTNLLRDGQGKVLAQTTSQAGSTPVVTRSLTWDIRPQIPELASEELPGAGATPPRITRLTTDPLGRVATQSVDTGTGTRERSIFAHDLLGAPTDEVPISGGASGSITESVDWSPFGVPRSPVGAPPGPVLGTVSPIGFGGLTTSGFGPALLARDRAYSPDQGRWLGTDPITPPLGSTTSNTYTYANNQPTQYTDPLGTCVWQLGQCGGFWHDAGQAALGVTDVATNLLATAGQNVLNPVYATLIHTDHFLTLSQKGCTRAATTAGTQATLHTATTIATTTGFTSAATQLNRPQLRTDSPKTFGSDGGTKSPTVTLIPSREKTLADALRVEKLDHVFHPKHGFDSLLNRVGSREIVMQKIVDSLGTDLPTSGRFEVTRTVMGEKVTIRGAVVDGVPRIGTAFTP